MNRLKPLISIIKTDEPAEAKKAQKQIEDYYRNHEFPLTKKVKKQFEIFIKEFGLPGSGNSDIIGVDRDGRIYLIETKLAINPEAKREVIGQVFEYAAFLWEIGFEEFDRKLLKLTGKNLVSLIKNRIKDKGWSEEEFLSSVSDNLEKGVFSLIIAVDQINDSLKRIIDYMNLSGSFHFDIFVLEMAYFIGDKVEVVTPKLYGIQPPRVAKKQTYPAKIWQEKEYFEVLKDRTNEEIVTIIRAFYQKYKNNKKFKVWFSGGEKEGYIQIGGRKGNKDIHFFCIDNTKDARVWVGIKEAPCFEDLLKELFDNLSKKLELDYDFNQIKALWSKSFRLTDLNSEQRTAVIKLLELYLSNASQKLSDLE